MHRTPLGSEVMTLLHQINLDAISPAMELLPKRMDSLLSRHLLLTTGLQEGKLIYRKQQPNGPAHGLWQFERGGVKGVLNHRSTRSYAESICGNRGVKPTISSVYEALPHDDILAAGFARLNYWWHSEPIPPLGAREQAWNYYLFCWRPGKPHRQTWNAHYDRATEYLLCHNY